ncbi:hypothetical protein SAMN03097699_1543 [Flavobacteriaceae bacterium MAR_2010_188]|nr:hypothetical protein SAMN03097699_1543 [Flavobacteriaceae bacterium MAR_2010_188]
MNKQVNLLILPLLFLSFNLAFAQDSKIEPAEKLSQLFLVDDPLEIAMNYSNKEIKKETDDSTYISTYLKYKEQDVAWDSLEVDIRRRGNFRLKTCYYAPLKLKIKKKNAERTPFEGNKTLKMVLPCLQERDKDDNVIKEYLAYKMFEIISPYHFKTRLLNLNYEEEKGKNNKSHQIKAFLIEDDKHVAKRIGGKVLDRNVHPLNHLPLESLRNAFFQFMIGNTDFSDAYQHNSKLIFLEGQIIPVPYDFDMCGFVNTSYATVSQIGDKQLDIESVTQRLYRGFKREDQLVTEVRLEFVAKRLDILSQLDKCETMFDNSKEFDACKDYINEFFTILMDDKKFEDQIASKSRNE